VGCGYFRNILFSQILLILLLGIHIVFTHCLGMCWKEEWILFQR
jgi:hypothetical protein